MNEFIEKLISRLEELNAYKLGECMNDCEHYENCANYIYSKGYNKAIDDFAEMLREICSNHSVGSDNKNNNEPLYAHEDGTWHSLIDDVAEQLKAGGVE